MKIRCRLPSEPYVPLTTIYCCLLGSVTIDSSVYYIMAVAGLLFSYGMFVHRLLGHSEHMPKISRLHHLNTGIQPIEIVLPL